MKRFFETCPRRNFWKRFLFCLFSLSCTRHGVIYLPDPTDLPQLDPKEEDDEGDYSYIAHLPLYFPVSNFWIAFRIIAMKDIPRLIEAIIMQDTDIGFLLIRQKVYTIHSAIV